MTVTARSLADYQSMFGLDGADLTRGPVLDCPGGASSFTAQVRAQGVHVVSADPVYAHGAAEVIARVRANLRDAAQIFADSTIPIDWSYLGSPQAYVRASQAALTLFAADFTGPGRSYVAAALPRLPFADRSFRLALTSHLFFVYSAQFSFADHVAALLELARVTTTEVRIHPLVDETGVPYPRLTELQDVLSKHGISTEIQPIRQTWIAGAANMLVCRS